MQVQHCLIVDVWLHCSCGMLPLCEPVPATSSKQQTPTQPFHTTASKRRYLVVARLWVSIPDRICVTRELQWCTLLCISFCFKVWMRFCSKKHVLYFVTHSGYLQAIAIWMIATTRQIVTRLKACRHKQLLAHSIGRCVSNAVINCHSTRINC
jgi:hypothetical protein